VCILAGNFAELLKSLSWLISMLYTKYDMEGQDLPNQVRYVKYTYAVYLTT
jgi:hypothetical protein